ncbi:MAG: substrate-binding domain-containing protein, partial [Caldilineales bacterium]|nr:substrate-binding domain-containing protein [Caldilineales bacterium]
MNTRRKFTSIISLFIVVAILLSACAMPAAAPAPAEAPTTAPAAPAEEGKVYKIAFSIPGLNFPFFVHMDRSIKAAAAEMGNVEIITLDGQDRTEKQVADLESVITQGLDGLIVSPRTTEGVGEAIQAVIDAGIPVVTVDRRAEGVNGLLAHVGAENVLGGEA